MILSVLSEDQRLRPLETTTGQTSQGSNPSHSAGGTNSEGRDILRDCHEWRRIQMTPLSVYHRQGWGVSRRERKLTFRTPSCPRGYARQRLRLTEFKQWLRHKASVLTAVRTWRLSDLAAHRPLSHATARGVCSERFACRQMFVFPSGDLLLSACPQAAWLCTADCGCLLPVSRLLARSSANTLLTCNFLRSL
jgi:hypothetical protein